ncbi:ATP-binding cassette sub-family G member 4-like [Panonychus citri]|uniref:ATP-binding cassette sub-family G member 4-like n=1 Tax=Panonychus citri TaxID=50023 RepID=UPI0023076649|nr:ATP-binding cassette sub-family G member 4-like [Panonychus citri]
MINNNNNNNNNNLVKSVEINPKLTNRDPNELISFDNYLYCEPSFSVDWFNLNYSVYPTMVDKLINRYKGKRNYENLNQPFGVKKILHNLSGSFQSGKLSAIMGPSGSGKSTLIECLAGIREKGLKGDIMCRGKSKVTKSFIPQEDQLHQGLTVRESLTYSYGLKCGSRLKEKNSKEKTRKVESLINQLHLIDCSDTVTGVISGGQKKRTLIAQELVSKPDILFIDEPTSGLDSLSCQLLIKLLQKLAFQSSIAIIITIHQPSAKIFNNLHDVYMLSSTGQAIFHGLPQQVIPTLDSMGIKCDPFNNPSDLLIEVAFGEYGLDCIDKMVHSVDSASKVSYGYSDDQSETKPIFNEKLTLSISKYSCKPLSDCYIYSEAPFFAQFKLLFYRQLTISARNPFSSSVRFFFAILLIVLLGGVYSGKGVYDGCVPDINNSTLTDLSSIRKSIELYTVNTRDNAISFYFLCTFITLTNILPMSVLIPQEMKLFRKEHFNGWYRTSAYFLARNLADIPFILMSVVTCVTGTFVFTGQPFSRYIDCLFIFTILAFIASTQGFITGIIFMNDTMTSVVSGPTSQAICLLFSGFFSPIELMPLPLRLFSSLSYLKHGFIAYTIAIFRDRCNPETLGKFADLKSQLVNYLDTVFKVTTAALVQLSEDKEIESLTNETTTLKDTIVDNLTYQWFKENNQSMVFDYYRLQNASYNQAIIGLIFSLLIGQLIAYWLIKLRVNY